MTTFVLVNGELQPVRQVTVQVGDESELSSAAMSRLDSSSVAHLAGWVKAWQKKNDGTWEPMRKAGDNAEKE